MAQCPGSGQQPNLNRYVAPNGNDANPGTLQLPSQTVSKALDNAKQLWTLVPGLRFTIKVFPSV